MDLATVAALEAEYIRMNTSFDNLGVRQTATLYTHTTSAANSLGEKGITYTTSSITIKVWSYTDREIISSQGLINDTMKKVITETSVTIDDQIVIDTIRYDIVSVLKNVLGSTVWYEIQARHV